MMSVDLKCWKDNFFLNCLDNGIRLVLRHNVLDNTTMTIIQITTRTEVNEEPSLLKWLRNYVLFHTPKNVSTIFGLGKLWKFSFVPPPKLTVDWIWVIYNKQPGFPEDLLPKIIKSPLISSWFCDVGMKKANTIWTGKCQHNVRKKN